MRTTPMRLLGFLTAFSDGRLPGIGGSSLARCHHPGCRWRDFVYRVDAMTGCRLHPGESRKVRSGTRLSVRCFGSPSCQRKSVDVVYSRDLHTREDFRCSTHRQDL
ncbi:hypothetical protein GCM10010435_28160 [Winogradskya consettensis]|uniref:Uncharacterized protein n=1 Tax=Winogradskya consettensis TaxID=113560 RepID=A0A919SG28_9ACTN|nr:hypothetical protein [Actinoplanes consettensis]GIM71024.1 hypothetical protein Aco04nite_23350 [Actinoplanes consettensis]